MGYFQWDSPAFRGLEIRDIPKGFPPHFKEYVLPSVEVVGVILPLVPLAHLENLKNPIPWSRGKQGDWPRKERAVTATVPGCSQSSWQPNRPRPNSRLENKPAQDILMEQSQGQPRFGPGSKRNLSTPGTTSQFGTRPLREVMLTVQWGRRKEHKEKGEEKNFTPL